MKSGLVLFFLGFSSTLFSQTYAYGNYTGTGVAKSITGLGFSPECVIIKQGGATGTGAIGAVIATANMDAGETKDMSSASTACATGQITSLDADGFTIGTGSNTNTSTSQYQWIAFNESTNIHIGTYAGDGVAEVVTGCGFQPDAILLWGDVANGSGNVTWQFSSASFGAAGDEGFYTRTTTSTGDLSADVLASYDADGFTTGALDGTANPSSPNKAGTNYYYIAFNESGNTIAQNEYTSSAGPTDNTTIAITGASDFQPDFLVTIPITVGSNAIFRIASLNSGDDVSLYFRAIAAAANKIQAFSATGFNAGTGSEVQANSTVFAYFAMGGGTSLPVQMTSFDAKKEGDNVGLSWQTASEINSDYFNILHSTDGENFEVLGTVNAAGNSTFWLDYYFVHQNVAEGIHYYQLEEVDRDGTRERFKIIVVNINNAVNAITQFYPNPSSSLITLYYNSAEGGIYFLNIVDMSGKELYTAQIPSVAGENKFNLTLQDFEAGTYLINLMDPRNEISTVRVMKKD